MTYVGWRDVKAAMRYLEGADVGLKERFEQGLDQALPASVASPQKPTPKLPDLPEIASAAIEVSLLLSAFNGSKRSQARALREMTESCLARFQVQPIDGERSRYRIAVPNPSPDVLDDHLYALLDELHQIADARACFLEAVCRDPESGKHWD